MRNKSEAPKPIIVGVHIDPSGMYLGRDRQKFCSVIPQKDEAYGDSLNRVARTGAGFLLIPYIGASSVISRSLLGPKVVEAEMLFVDELERDGIGTAVLPDSLTSYDWQTNAHQKLVSALNSWNIELNSATRFILIGAYFGASVIHTARKLITLLEKDGITSVQIDPTASRNGIVDQKLSPGEGFEIEEGDSNLITVRRSRN